MVHVQLDSYGIRMVWKGELTQEDLRRWLALLHEHLDGFEGALGVLSDARAVVVSGAVPQWALDGVNEGQRFLCQVGMRRSAVILSDVAHCARLKLLARSLDRLEDERYIDPRRNPHWEAHAIRWITDAVEPEGRFDFGLDVAEQLTQTFGRLVNAPLEEVLRIARDHALIDDWSRREGHLSWRADGVVVQQPVVEAERHLRSRLLDHILEGHPL